MRFGIFGGARVGKRDPLGDSYGYTDFVEYVKSADQLGFESAFMVEHHFTGFGQVSASLNLLTWVAARTTTLRLGTAVIVLPWHNPVLLAEQAARSAERDLPRPAAGDTEAPAWQARQIARFEVLHVRESLRRRRADRE